MLTCPYSVLKPYSTWLVAPMSVLQVIVAAEVVIAEDCTALTFAGIVVSIVSAKVLNS